MCSAPASANHRRGRSPRYAQEDSSPSTVSTTDADGKPASCSWSASTAPGDRVGLARVAWPSLPCAGPATPIAAAAWGEVGSASCGGLRAATGQRRLRRRPSVASRRRPVSAGVTASPCHRRGSTRPEARRYRSNHRGYVGSTGVRRVIVGMLLDGDRRPHRDRRKLAFRRPDLKFVSAVPTTSPSTTAEFVDACR